MHCEVKIAIRYGNRLHYQVITLHRLVRYEAIIGLTKYIISTVLVTNYYFINILLEQCVAFCLVSINSFIATTLLLQLNHDSLFRKTRLGDKATVYAHVHQWCLNPRIPRSHVPEPL